MKFILLLLVSFYLYPSLGSTFAYKDLVKIKNIYYNKYTNKLYTGKIKGLLEGSFLQGKKYGVFTKYYSDGKILSKINYFDRSFRKAFCLI